MAGADATVSGFSLHILAVPKNPGIYRVASAPTVTGSVFMQRFRLFFGPCDLPVPYTVGITVPSFYNKQVYARPKINSVCEEPSAALCCLGGVGAENKNFGPEPTLFGTEPEPEQKI